MEIRRDLAKEIFTVIREVIGERSHASSAISSSLTKKRDWSDRKIALFSNTVYDIIRNWRLLWMILDREPSMEDRHLWHLLGALYILKGEPLPKRDEYRGLQLSKMQKRLERSGSFRPLRESIPDWLDRLGERELGKEWDPVLHSLNTYPPLAVRANTLKVPRDELRKRLRSSGHDTDTVQWAPDAAVFRTKCNAFRLEEFKEGLFEVQDPASQAVSEFLGAEPGLKVVDACAGQGGKTLHLSCLMGNRGRLIAMDNSEWKLKELRKRASRAGAQNIETRPVEGTKSYKRLKGTADRLLLDVPCSGLGALRRNPDIKWSLDQETLDRLRGVQRNILTDYSPLLKIGGRMVYATCSILPSEGEEQVRWFVKQNEGLYQLLEEKRLSPSSEGFDGFYMALIEREA
ncbi:MAG: RsmB/NOP family class I SAM-dependent RNA methyltransferase [Thermoplasmatota archaeon]